MLLNAVMNGSYTFNTFKSLVLDVITDSNVKKEMRLVRGKARLPYSRPTSQ
jgi:hypothetical protein